jgi:NADPH:quinone reductase-like Zn-dependent oxidoreductase
MAPALLGGELIYVQGAPAAARSQGPAYYRVMETVMDRVVTFAEFGGPEVLEIESRAAAEPGHGEVRVRMAFAGLNPVDYKIRQGGPAYGTTLPSRIGRELSGLVIAAGKGVSRLSVGDRVFGTIPVGALADAVTVPESLFARVPAGLPMDVAGGLALAGQTAWDSLASQALEAGDTIVVSAAAGGVGGILSQLAVRAGVRVIGSASAGNHDWLRSRGVEPILYGPDLVETVRALAPDGVTAAFDLHGAESVQQFLVLGIAPQRINTNAMGTATPEGIQRVGRGGTDLGTLDALAHLVADGSVEVPIAARFELGDVAEAFTFLEGGHLRGKVVVSGRA